MPGHRARYNGSKGIRCGQMQAGALGSSALHAQCAADKRPQPERKQEKETKKKRKTNKYIKVDRGHGGRRREAGLALAPRRSAAISRPARPPHAAPETQGEVPRAAPAHRNQRAAMMQAPLNGAVDSRVSAAGARRRGRRAAARSAWVVLRLACVSMAPAPRRVPPRRH